MREANKFGLVRVHSAGGDFEYLDLYNQLRQSDELTLRFYIAYFLDPPELKPDEIEKIEQARRTYHDDWISGGVVKTMLDGVVEAHTAAMLDTLQRRSDQDRQTVLGPGEIQASRHRTRPPWACRFLPTPSATKRCGWHSMPIRARRKRITLHDMRPRIEHIETISAQDIPRFGKLGVIASFQPLHAYPDEDTLGIWARNVGPERAQRAWVWHSIESTGGSACLRQRLAGGDAESLAGGAECFNPKDAGKAILRAALCLRSASAWKTRSRPILWARPLPGIVKRQKAQSNPENSLT